MMDLLHSLFLAAGSLVMLATLPSLAELIVVTTGALRRRSFAPAIDCSDFSLAVIVPAHNEEDLIHSCVTSLVDSGRGGPSCSIVVVADNCTDRTAERAEEAGARVLIRQDLLNRGKSFALRYAFDVLLKENFDAFLVIDADSMVSPNLIGEVSRAMVTGADAVQARYRVARPLDSSRKRLMDVALLAFTVLRPRGRYGWGMSAGIMGNGFALSRKTLLDVPYSANSIVEDLEYHLLLVSAGKVVRFADGATVFGDMPSDSDAQLSQRARWEGGRAHVAFTSTAKLISQLLAGNLMVAEPILELLTFPLAYLAVGAVALAVLPISLFRCYGLALTLVLFLHVVFSILLGGTVSESLAGLATAPGYIFWKFMRLDAILRSSSSKTQWIRTPRASEVKGKAPHV